MRIQVEHLHKAFDDFVAVDDVSFTVEHGELTALLGPSGSGKSTILRMLAGLESLDAGAIRFDGEPAERLHARARQVGFVFQHYALFRHLSVEQNVGFGLEVQGVAKAAIKRRVGELLERTGLAGLGKRYPSQLSGGQCQRVALARALAPEPRVLLLDEPFGAVDAKVREELREWLRRLHDDIGVTSLFVTHDQEEAFSVSDRVIVMNRGRVEQVGAPGAILDQPASEFVACFLGEVSVFPARIEAGHALAGALRAQVPDAPEHARVQLVIRSYDLKLWREEPGVASVRRMVTLGDRVRVYAEVDGAGPIVAQFPRRSSLLHGVEPGCRVQIEVTRARVYPVAGSPGQASAPLNP